MYNEHPQTEPEFKKYVDHYCVDISAFSELGKKHVNDRLAAGLDLFGWKHTVTPKKGKPINFVVANDCVAGRGLRYANAMPCPKGVYVTTIPGDIVQTLDGSEPSGDAFKWLVNKKKGTFLVLHPPTWDALGNLINTSDGKTPNNCRLQYKQKNSYVNVISTRIIYPGDELLVPYGSKFTGNIRDWLRTAANDEER